MADLERFFVEELPARLRRFLGPAELPTIGTADNVQEAMLQDVLLPAVLGIYARGPSETIRGSRLLVIGRRTQMRLLRVSLALVTDSYASHEDGRLGALRLLPRVEDAVVGWRPTWIKRAFQFLDDPFVMRVNERSLHEIQIEGKYEDFTAPLVP